jgi:hypothetical protein
VANRRVRIYERVKTNSGWKDRPVLFPPRLKPDGKLYLKDDREGAFIVSWYEGRVKRRHPKTCTWLGEALRVKADKEWYLQNLHRGVKDPTVPDTRLPISVAVASYIDGVTGADKTRSAHKQAVTEFEDWNAKNKELPDSQRKKFVDEIDTRDSNDTQGKPCASRQASPKLTNDRTNRSRQRLPLAVK